MTLEFDTRVDKRLKLKLRKILGLITTFVEVRGEKLIWWNFFGYLILNRVNTRILSGTSFNANIFN